MVLEPALNLVMPSIAWDNGKMEGVISHKTVEKFYKTVFGSP